MSFNIICEDKKSNARVGKFKTDHGIINTPIFMPVGTLGSVRGIHQSELNNEIKAEIILGNTYHLFLRPGIDTIQKVGGIHKFIGYNKPILTDSGGYQVYSLSANRKITEQGVNFKSHIDGSSHFFTPEKAIEIQRKIGADIIMAFDECTPYPCEHNYVKKSMELTHRWLERCKNYFDKSCNLYNYKQYLFPIVQGGTHNDLRKISAEKIASFDFQGYAIGGLSVGEPHEEMYSMTKIATDILPINKPRYLMGVGTPINLLECISLGVDMFDCVLPTRNARNGLIYTMNGSINIKNKKWKNDFSLIDDEGDCYVDKNYSKAYLRHLIISNEMLGKQIASIHNLAFYRRLINKAKEEIKKENFYDWKQSIIKKLKNRL
ncbi:MAG: tRNA guanosine(34) transglycosylase Tgt [Flavobacteriales bacterium]|nr:tRNA guanosine(34) transglycosylase Tgt [Flavobacteriales bacterium]|tara:strand:- start:7920 stop:9050 length:1131 start_codon:yes stop_codon:yes gene_type:complete